MTAENLIFAWIFTGIFLAAFLVGFVSSLRLTRRYLQARQDIEPQNRLVLISMVVACWMITAAAGWFGVLSVYRLLTQAVIEWTPPITLAISTAIVFIPLMFDLAITHVARSEAEATDPVPSIDPPSS